MKQIKASDKQSAEFQKSGPKNSAQTALRFKKPGTAGKPVVLAIGESLQSLLPDLCKFTGTKHAEVAVRIVDQVASGLVQHKSSDTNAVLIQAIRTISEMAPQNAGEAMLVAQMIATHEAALLFLYRATQDGNTIEANNANSLRAIRLMRLHLEQIEAIQKLRGKAGQQKMIVEHVHVHKGGQAIVGTVGSSRRVPGGRD